MTSRSRSFCLLALFLAAFSCAVRPCLAATASASAADKSFLAAVAKADTTSVESFLDTEFTWTDRAGKTWSRSDALAKVASLARTSDTDTIVVEHGQVALIRGTDVIPLQNASVRFARVWVQRPSGWKLLAFQETTKAEKTPTKRSGFGSPSGGQAISCENPCKTVPYNRTEPQNKRS